LFAFATRPGNDAGCLGFGLWIMTSCERSLFDELDDVLRNGSSDKRVDMLRRVTDLFLTMPIV